MSEAKPYDIPKQLVWEAYQRVKANRGAAGVDGVSLAAYEQNLKGMPLHAHHTAAQIIDVACKPDRNGGFEHPEFRDLILRVAGDRGQASSKSLPYCEAGSFNPPSTMAAYARANGERTACGDGWRLADL